MQAFRIYIFWQSQGWQNGLPGQRQNGRKSKGRRHCEFGKVIKSAESDIGAGQKGSVGSEARWGQCGEAPGKLGLLEDALIRIAALTGSADIDLSVRRLYLMCADNGVVAQNVTQTGSEVTRGWQTALPPGKAAPAGWQRWRTVR